MIFPVCCLFIMKFEPLHDKTNNLRFQPGPTQTELYKHRRWLEARSFGFKKKRDYTIHVAKTNALICAFGFAYADCWFSDAVALTSVSLLGLPSLFMVATLLGKSSHLSLQACC